MIAWRCSLGSREDCPYARPKNNTGTTGTSQIADFIEKLLWNKFLFSARVAGVRETLKPWCQSTYSGNLNCPWTSKSRLTDGAPVPGCPPIVNLAERMY